MDSSDGFMEDFYGDKLSVLTTGYLRDEANFNGLDELISCINCDIERSKARLAEEGMQKLTHNEWATSR